MTSLFPILSAFTGEGDQGLSSPEGEAQTEAESFEQVKQTIRSRLQGLALTGTDFHPLFQIPGLQIIHIGFSSQSLGEPLHELHECILSENSTTQQQTGKQLKNRVEVLFRSARNVQFEDGMENEFSKEFIRYIERYGNLAIDTIAETILAEDVSPTVASEALRWLAEVDEFSSYQKRLWLLERSLYCSSAVVRDGAVLGLAALDNPHAISFLKSARDQESVSDLRRDMDQVLEQLQETLECHSY